MLEPGGIVHADRGVQFTSWAFGDHREKWKTRLKLANATFDYIKIFYNRRRRHSSLDYRIPIEQELISEKNPIPA